MKANVSELKAICKQYKLICTGKKQELMDRIIKHINQ